MAVEEVLISSLAVLADLVRDRMQVNEQRHKSNPMPEHPSIEARIRWHAQHAQACGCRPIPAGVRKEMERRKMI